MEELDENNTSEFERILIRMLFAKPHVRDKVMPYMSVELFNDHSNKNIVKEIIDFNTKFNSFPKGADLLLNIQNEKVRESFKEIGKIDPSKYNEANLLDKIQLFFRKGLLWNELANNVELIKENKLDEVDPQKMMEAKAFSFEDSIGIELMDDDGERLYNRLHDEEIFVKTGLKQFDHMMNGGFKKKTFTMLIGGTNIGKTLFKCSLAKQCLLQNYNVLFIPLEGTEEDIEDRIMFNLLDKTQDELKAMEKGLLKDLISKTKNIVKNKLVIKRYNQHSFSASKFRLLLKELKQKKNFIPDIVFIDYLGLTIPNVVTKDGGNQASLLKRSSEEFHGVAKDENFALISSMQFNREGFKSSNPNMDDISESFGPLFTANAVILLMQTEEMQKENKYIYKKVKARSKNKGFVGNVSVDFAKQKLFEPDANHYSEVERKKIEQIVNQESSEVEEMMQKVEQHQTKKLVTVDFT